MELYKKTAAELVIERNKSRKLFDSADWVMEGEKYHGFFRAQSKVPEALPGSTLVPDTGEVKEISITAAEKIAREIARRRLRLRGRSYFDSADYAVEGRKYLESYRPTIV
eukprot:TRINITY_DN7914_c0_g1_i1.p1 TRINITY_DN7914_c0_g1~~TRINITY_DN7914_c0_g1_i1.p1  ORF type:complete len:110 (+),score=13.01 TRINITY_DN7914_c0_g1_i1:156-485(+)